MALSRKPKTQSEQPTNVEDFIRGGGEETPPADAKVGKGQFANVRLRIPTDILDEVDEAVRGRRSGMARHAWIMEAIVEKLERDRK